MKKFTVLLIVLAVMAALVSCATKAPAEEAPVAAAPVAEAPKAEASNVCPFAGEYYVEFTSQDATEPEPGEEFTIGEDWTVSGAMEGSGMTGFAGTIAADGSFTAEFTRLGGSMTGQVNPDGTLTATAETRGRTSTITGYKL